jgi:putative addiction module killer protein
MGYTTPVYTILTTNDYDHWFGKLRGRQARARIDARLTRVALGNLGDAKPVGGKVSEIRIDYGAGYRLYFVRRGFEVILLLVGGDKTAQQRDIDRAIDMAAQLKG